MLEGIIITAIVTFLGILAVLLFCAWPQFTPDPEPGTHGWHCSACGEVNYILPEKPAPLSNQSSDGVFTVFGEPVTFRSKLEPCFACGARLIVSTEYVWPLDDQALHREKYHGSK